MSWNVISGAWPGTRKNTACASARTRRRTRSQRAYRFGVELDEPGDQDGTAAHGIAPAGAVLIRPDGFVAWRSGPVPDVVAGLRQAMRSILRPGEST